MEENKEIKKDTTENQKPVAAATEMKTDANGIKTRQGSGYLKQLYATARTTATNTHSHFKNLTTFLVNFIPVDAVDASELQVRVHFDDAEIKGLSESVKEHGVLQPILVVQDGDRYKVIAGERRLRAAKMAGMDRIPARVLTTNDKATHEIALRENLDRVDLHPLEEGEGYVSLLDSGAFASHEAIAKAFHKPKSRITECVGFCKLPTETKAELLRTGLKSRVVLRQLLNTPAEAHMKMIADAADIAEEMTIQPELVLQAREKAAKKAAAEKKEPKPFEYKLDDKGLAVPGFKWKTGEGKEKLSAYVDALYKLVDELDKLTKA